MKARLSAFLLGAALGASLTLVAVFVTGERAGLALVAAGVRLASAAQAPVFTVQAASALSAPAAPVARSPRR